MISLRAALLLVALSATADGLVHQPGLLGHHPASSHLASQRPTLISLRSNKAYSAAARRNASPRAATAAAVAEDEPLPKTVLPISLSVFAQQIGEGIAISTLPLHMRSLGATPVQIGMATSAFSFSQLVMCPVLVKISTRVGRRRVLRVCLAGASLAQLVITFSSSVYMILFGRCALSPFSPLSRIQHARISGRSALPRAVANSLHPPSSFAPPTPPTATFAYPPPAHPSSPILLLAASSEACSQPPSQWLRRA